MSLGSYLVRLRTSRGWNQLDIARCAKTTAQNIAVVEQDLANASPRILAAYSVQCGEPLDAVVGAWAGHRRIVVAKAAKAAERRARELGMMSVSKRKPGNYERNKKR